MRTTDLITTMILTLTMVGVQTTAPPDHITFEVDQGRMNSEEDKQPYRMDIRLYEDKKNTY